MFTFWSSRSGMNTGSRNAKMGKTANRSILFDYAVLNANICSSETAGTFALYLEKLPDFLYTILCISINCKEYISLHGNSE